MGVSNLADALPNAFVPWIKNGTSARRLQGEPGEALAASRSSTDRSGIERGAASELPPPSPPPTGMDLSRMMDTPRDERFGLRQSELRGRWILVLLDAGDRIRQAKRPSLRGRIGAGHNGR